jgi:hypothetical protein
MAADGHKHRRGVPEMTDGLFAGKQPGAARRRIVSPRPPGGPTTGTDNGKRKGTAMQTRWVQTLRHALVVGLFSLALVAGLGAVGHASATEMDKGAFKTGCESGGGSYVENASDGSFQCNLKSGGTIKCADTKSQCTYTANLTSHRGSIVNLPVGSLVLQALDKGSVSHSMIRKAGAVHLASVGQHRHARHHGGA